MVLPPADALIAQARRVILADSAAVAAATSALGDSFVAVCGVLLDCTGKVLVTGSGTSGAVAIRAAHLLSVGGTPAIHVSPVDGLHGGLGVLRSNDVVIALSKGGRSAELNAFCEVARRLAGCLIVITAAPHSELARLGHHVLPLVLPDEADLGSVIATGSSLATAALLDALVDVVRVARGYSWEEVLRSHPSGAVGHDADAALRRLRDQPREGP